jgi:putative chitinase
MLSENDLRQIMPRIPTDKFQIYFLMLNRVMSDFQIDPPLRAAAFLAQLAHESGQLRFMEEIWGPTAAQLRYEPPSDLAAKLGNTQAGDGKLYRGRGPIQITGRSNYKRYGDMLGVDLIRNPGLAATTQIAFQIAGLYWVTNGLNELADVQDFIGITRRINGGTNGLADRQQYYAIAKNVLGVNDVVGGFRSTTARVSLAEASAVPQVSVSSPASLPPPKLPRGYEAILEDSEQSTPAAPTPSNGESKKKSARPSSRSTKKSVSKKSIKKGATQVPNISTKKSTKKTAKKPAAKALKSAAKTAAKKAPAKSAKPVAKKAAKKPAVKAAKKPAAKSAGKPAKKAAGKKPAIRIIIVKSAKKAAKKSK